MSDPGKAVFLSYASQDAEAARKICEALRSSGVEVWFDTDGGLEHGDEWDAKIRRQIKECVLFIPLVSANTQAREEGYFRIEWDLAAERARGIASGVAFILPVVIDDTKEPAALVPDRFRSVQWTRLPGGSVSPDVLARFLKLWSHRTGALKHAETVGRDLRIPPPATEAGIGDSALQKTRPRWLAPMIAGLAVAAIALLVAQPWRKPAPGPAESVKPAASLSDARQLTAKAWELMNKAELARAELDLADGFCQRATELDLNDADVWAAWSQVDSWYVYHNFDDSPSRREGARTKAARALQLAPRSYEARLAQACYLVRSSGGSGRTTSMFDEEAKSLLTALLQEASAEPRALLALGILLRNTGQVAEARATLEKLANNPAFAALAWNEIAWAAYLRGDYRGAEVAVDRSLALQACWPNLVLKLSLAEWWTGDLDQAKAMLEKIPVAVRQEDHGVAMACQLYHLRREPENLLRVLEGVPRDWLRSNAYDGPKAYWAGLAHELAGRKESAQLQWQAALQQTEQQLAVRPDSGNLLAWKGQLLAKLGRRDEAERSLRLAHDSGTGPGDFRNSQTLIINEILLGHEEAALALVEVTDFSAATYRNHPVFDSLRANPRFQAVLARLEADPRFSPKARSPEMAETKLGGSSFAKATEDVSGKAAPPDTKSVAVLAFANLSDDKANEYFSDGISEELLNVLAKIPGLKVSARTSAFFFKGKEVPIPEIAQKLGVAYVVEGSVRKQGDKVRITAQLIKAADGFHVWSDTFTRDLKDIFAVQDEIAGLIAQQLQLKLGESSRGAQVVNPEAYRLVLEGRAFWLLRTADGFVHAEAAYQKALALDPAFAQAHAGLADVWSIRAWYRQLGGEPDATDDLNRADAEAQTALRLDPLLAEPHAALGAIRFNQKRYAESEASYQEALRLNPNYAFAHHWHAQLRGNLGHLDEMLVGMDRSIEIDPLAFITLTSDSLFLTFAGRNQDALAISDRALAIRRELFVPLMGQRALLLHALGRKDEAIAAARLVLGNPLVEPRWWLDTVCVYVLRKNGLAAEAEAHVQRLHASLPAGNQLHASLLAAGGRTHEALEMLAANGVSSTSVQSIYYSEIWDEARREPKFLQVIAQLGCETDYRVARETLARVRGQQEARK